MNSLYTQIQPVVNASGYTLWWVRWLQGNTLQVFIESEKSIHIDDCEKVSRQLSAWLDVYDKSINAPIHYNLQVSSPGTERTLFIPEHYQRYQGSKIHCVLHQALHGNKHIIGIIQEVSENKVALVVDEQENKSSSSPLQEVAFTVIKRARLMYNPKEDLLKT